MTAEEPNAVKEMTDSIRKDGQRRDREILDDQQPILCLALRPLPVLGRATAVAGAVAAVCPSSLKHTSSIILNSLFRVREPIIVVGFRVSCVDLSGRESFGVGRI